MPNAGTAVGDRAAPVIDTGMGPRNGVYMLDDLLPVILGICQEFFGSASPAVQRTRCSSARPTMSPATPAG